MTSAGRGGWRLVQRRPPGELPAPSPERAGPWMPAAARAPGRGWGPGRRGVREETPRAGGHETVSSPVLKTEPDGEFREPPPRLERHRGSGDLHMGGKAS